MQHPISYWTLIILCPFFSLVMSGYFHTFEAVQYLQSFIQEGIVPKYGQKTRIARNAHLSFMPTHPWFWKCSNVQMFLVISPLNLSVILIWCLLKYNVRIPRTSREVYGACAWWGGGGACAWWRPLLSISRLSALHLLLCFALRNYCILHSSLMVYFSCDEGVPCNKLTG